MSAAIIVFAGGGALGLVLVRCQIDDGPVTVPRETVAYASSTLILMLASLAIGQGAWE